MDGVDRALIYPSLKVKINCVPMREMSLETYMQLALLAKDRKIDVRFIEMMPIGLGRDFSGVGRDEIYLMLKERFGDAEECDGQYGNGPAVYVRFPGFQGKIGFISAVTHQFCSDCNRIRLTSEGFLKACLQYEAGVDLRKIIRTGAEDRCIKQEMRRIIYEKPACHHFTNPYAYEEKKFEMKDMSQIGG